MTVENQVPHQSYTANGVDVSYTLSFYVEGKDNLEVTIGSVVQSKNNYNYDAATNSVVFNKPLAKGVIVEIKRVTPIEREIQYATYNNTFRPETLNFDIDRIIRILQELGFSNAVLAARLAKEIIDRTKGDQHLQDQILKEVDARIKNDKHLQEQITSNDFDISILLRGLNLEIQDRIQGDRDVALASRDYTDFMLKMNNTNPSIFEGIADNIVLTENGDSQRQVNRHIKEHGAGLPYQQSVNYKENAVIVKDGVLVQKQGNTWNRLSIKTTVATLQDLRNLKASEGDIVQTQGHTVVGIGGGTYQFEALLNKVDNNGAWVQSVVIKGCWKLISKLKFENFGVIESSSDQSHRIQACLDYARDARIYDISFERSNTYTIEKTVLIRPFNVSEREVYYSTAPKLSIKTNGAKFVTSKDNLTMFKVIREMAYIDVLNFVTTAKNVTGVQVGIDSLEDLEKGYVNSCSFFSCDKFYGTGLENGILFSPFGVFSSGSAYGAYYHEFGDIVFKDVTHGMVFLPSHDGRNQTTRSHVKSYKHNGGACAIVGLNLESFTISDFNVENLKATSNKYPLASQRAVYIPKFAEGSAYVNHSISISGACEEVPFPVFCDAERSEVNIFAGHYDVSQPSKAFSGNYTSAMSGTGQIPYVSPKTFYFAQSRCRFGVINTQAAISPDFPPIFGGEFYGSIKFEPASASNNETGSQILTAEYPNPSIWRRIVRGTNTSKPTFSPWQRIDKTQVESARDIDLNTLKTDDGSLGIWSVAITKDGFNSPNGGEYYGVVEWLPQTTAINEGIQVSISILNAVRRTRTFRGGVWSAWI